MGVLVKLIDAIMFMFLTVIAIGAPLIDSQTIFPASLFPEVLINLKKWYAHEYGDYLFTEKPHFFVGLVWLQLLFQWPLSLLNIMTSREEDNIDPSIQNTSLGTDLDGSGVSPPVDPQLHLEEVVMEEEEEDFDVEIIEGNDVENASQQFMDSMTIEHEPDFELSVDIVRKGVPKGRIKEILEAICFNFGYLAHTYSKCERPTKYAYPPIRKAVPLCGAWIKVGVPIRNCFDPKISLMQKRKLEGLHGLEAPTSNNIDKGKRVITSFDGDVPRSTGQGTARKCVVGSGSSGLGEAPSFGNGKREQRRMREPIRIGSRSLEKLGMMHRRPVGIFL
uniref:EXPERA domain-containing protein n=1 Tax=Cannabis sativa TaxID=3483 RepID=A0A803QJW8_CANSA